VKAIRFRARSRKLLWLGLTLVLLSFVPVGLEALDRYAGIDWNRWRSTEQLCCAIAPLGRGIQAEDVWAELNRRRVEGDLDDDDDLPPIHVPVVMRVD
jgi:hypothetical protein